LQFDGGFALVGYRVGGSPRAVALTEIVHAEADVDFALFAAEEMPWWVTPIDMAEAEQVRNRDRLTIYHYPGQLPLYATSAGCAAANVESLEFEHSCDTLDGSSGAPIFNARTGRIVGIHFRGIDPDERDLPLNGALNAYCIGASLPLFDSFRPDRMVQQEARDAPYWGSRRVEFMRRRNDDTDEFEMVPIMGEEPEPWEDFAAFNTDPNGRVIVRAFPDASELDGGSLEATISALEARVDVVLELLAAQGISRDRVRVRLEPSDDTRGGAVTAVWFGRQDRQDGPIARLISELPDLSNSARRGSMTLAEWCEAIGA